MNRPLSHADTDEMTLPDGAADNVELTPHGAPSALEGPSFTDLDLPAALLQALADAGYTQPTEVQTRAIPAAMQGQDLRVASSTGSGKTAAFMLPALASILAARGDNTKRREKGKVFGPRVLVLTPTRELALQVAKAASTYGRHLQGLRVATVVGGVPYGYQLKALRGPLDVLIATPGRLIDHLRSGAAVLSNLEMLVLDEADRMLDMGFIEDIETIAQETPENRQTLMFSATFAGHVGKLAERLTHDARHIEVASHTDSHDNIEQRMHLADTLHHKNDLLDHVLCSKEVDQAVVFTSTQRDADILADRLADMGHAVAALHGGMPQGRRNRVLQALRTHQLRVLVATDVAARGIDVPTITHVINYGLPMKPEDYVHRIGRTGRAGRSGLAVTLVERRDIPMIRRIERFTTQRIPEAVIAGLEPKMKAPAERPGRDRGQGGGHFGGGGFGGGRGRQGGHGGSRGFGAPRAADSRFDSGRGDAPFRGPGKPFQHKAAGDGSFFNSDQARSGRPSGDRHPRDGKPFADRPTGGKPANGKPFGQKANGPGKSFGDKPFGGKGHFTSERRTFKDGPKRSGAGRREG